ncbi:MAG: SusC/RagA family TonB-linked outer membrane protein [Cytophagales bacterium]|nr:SusC/RagA family TonB-linked outer membrane protein [Cytophagales bacterium]
MKKKVLRLFMMVSKFTLYGAMMQVIFFSLVLAHSSDAQQFTSVRDIEIDVEFHQSDMLEVINSIESGTNYQFVYYPSDIENIKNFNLERQRISVADLLLKLSKDYHVAFQQVNNSITIKELSEKQSKAKKPLEIILDGITITGKVTSSEDGQGLPGVNVIVKGTSQGTVTDVEGGYSLEVPEEASVLVFSFVGYAEEEVEVGVKTVIDVSLTPDLTQLQEIVVTALGVNKERKSLGYSVDQLSSEELHATGEPSMVLNLAGKAPGVLVTGSSNGLDGSPRVLIRGVTSLSADNQPLYVIDGVPVQSNRSLAESLFTSSNGSSDFGNPISDINPNDIESMSILKGASATALYGSRGANGVILITTKKGDAGRKGLGVSFSNSTTFQNPLVLPEIQTEYGQGFNGEFEYVDGTGNGTNERESRMWGPRYEGQMISQWDPATGNAIVKEWKPYGKDNLKNFFETGHTIMTNLALTHNTENSDVRLSIGHQDQKGIVPNTNLERFTGSLNTNFKLGKRLTADAIVSFSRTDIGNRSSYGFGNGGMWSALFIPTNIDIRDLRNYKDEAGNKRSYMENGPNPYWDLYENINPTLRRRFSGKIGLNYNLTDWLSLQGNVYNDQNTTEYERIVAKHIFDNGSYEEGFIFNEEINADVKLSLSKDLSQDLNIGAFIGAATRKDKNIDKNARTEGGLLVREIYNLGNSAKPPVVNNSLSEMKINSVFGALDLNYKDYLFITLTGRNDWSSTLPEDNWSFFYPSVSGSFVFSKIFGIEGRSFSFGKLRASWAKVGNDTNPYSLQRYITRNSASFNGQPVLGLDNVIPALSLKPEETTAIEIGAELGFLDNKVMLDVAYYNNESGNQLVRIENAWERGARFAFINSGSITNEGVELKLDVAAINTRDFKWDISLNWSKNEGTVSGFPEDLIDFKHIAAWFGPEIRATNGKPYGHVVGFEYFTDSQQGYENIPNMKQDYEAFGYTPESNIYGTGKVLTRNGFPMHNVWRGTRDLGFNVMNDWAGGLFNSFRYKDFQLGVLIDYRRGGYIISTTQVYMLRYGLMNETAGENAQGGLVRANVSEGGGILFDGIDVETGEQNEVYIDAQDYYSGWNLPTSVFTSSATNVKLKELSLTYHVPRLIVNKLRLQQASVSFIGRNLWVIKNEMDGFDAETANMGSLNNGVGFETGSIPNTRSLGFSLNLNF